MNLWEFITVVAIAGMLTGVIQSWLKSKQGTASSEKETIQHQQSLAALEERVKVLEAIVTDSKYDLKREFENLKQKENV